MVKYVLLVPGTLVREMLSNDIRRDYYGICEYNKGSALEYLFESTFLSTGIF